METSHAFKAIAIVAIKSSTGLLVYVKAHYFMAHCDFWIPHRTKAWKQLYILQPQVSESSENAGLKEVCQFLYPDPEGNFCNLIMRC